MLQPQKPYLKKKNKIFLKKVLTWARAFDILGMPLKKKA
jgi:hypothetical protein